MLPAMVASAVPGAATGCRVTTGSRPRASAVRRQRGVGWRTLSVLAQGANINDGQRLDGDLSFA